MTLEAREPSLDAGKAGYFPDAALGVTLATLGARDLSLGAGKSRGFSRAVLGVTFTSLEVWDLFVPFEGVEIVCGGRGL